jgi:hypothetical protein
MNKQSRITLAIVAAMTTLVIGACATPKPGSPEATLLEQQQAKIDQKKQAQESIGAMPDWYSAPPADGITINAAATAVSNDMQLAVDKATQDAKANLADKLQGLMSGKMKQFVSESGSSDNSDLQKESTRVSSNLFTNVSLAGYIVKEQKLIQQGTGFRSFVLVSYPIGMANRLLVEKIKENSLLNTKLAASKAYEELEREIQKSQPK